MLYVATRTLVKVEPDDPRLVPALIRLLSATYDYQRIEAVQSLGVLGPRAAPAVDELVDILKRLTSSGPNPFAAVAPGEAFGFSGGGGMFGSDVNVVVIETLGKIGPAARPALPLLREIAGMTNYANVARKAVMAIEGSSPRVEEPAPGDDAAALRFDGKTFGKSGSAS